MKIGSLSDQWRAKAETIRPYAPEAAKAFDEAAADLDAAVTCEDREELTPRQAAIASGYSAVHIRRLIDEGTIPNVGTPDAPKVRRCDLPRKPGHGIVASGELNAKVTASQAVRAVVAGN